MLHLQLHRHLTSGEIAVKCLSKTRKIKNNSKLYLARVSPLHRASTDVDSTSKNKLNETCLFCVLSKKSKKAGLVLCFNVVQDFLDFELPGLKSC